MIKKRKGREKTQEWKRKKREKGKRKSKARQRQRKAKAQRRRAGNQEKANSNEVNGIDKRRKSWDNLRHATTFESKMKV